MPMYLGVDIEKLPQKFKDNFQQISYKELMCKKCGKLVIFNTLNTLNTHIGSKTCERRISEGYTAERTLHMLESFKTT